MSKANTGVEKHARQIQNSDTSDSRGIRDSLPDFSTKTWIVITLIISIILLVLWWRSSNDSGGVESDNNGDDDDGGADLSVEEESDETQITMKNDPLAKDKIMEKEMKEAGFIDGD